MSDSVKPKVPRTMRVFQVYYTFAVVVSLAAVVFLTTSQTPFTFDMYLGLLFLIYASVLLWLLWSRKRVARYVVPVFAIVYFLVGSIGGILLGDYPFGIDAFTNNGRAIELLAGLYFFTSRKVRAVLTEDFNVAPSENRGTETGLFRPKELLFWRNILLYFMVFAVVGHWLELVYNTFLRYFANQYDPNSGIWSDYLYPYNVYGVGAVACVLLLYPLKDFLSKKIPNILVVLGISFVFNAAVCTLIEFIMGMMVNMPDAYGVHPLWDYSDIPFNFMGQICLQNTLAFGVASTFMVWIAFPALERLIGSLKKDTMTIVSIAIIIFYLILSALYFFEFPLPSLV